MLKYIITLLLCATSVMAQYGKPAISAGQTLPAADGGALTNLPSGDTRLAQAHSGIPSNQFTTATGYNMITNLNAGYSNNIGYIDSTSILIHVDGVYLLELHASFLTASAADTHIGAFSNSVAGGRTPLKVCSFFRSYSGGGNDFGVGGASQIVPLRSNDWLTLEMWSGANEEVTFAPLSFGIEKIGD